MAFTKGRTLRPEERHILLKMAEEDIMSSSKKTPAKLHISNLTGVYIYKPLLKLKVSFPYKYKFFTLSFFITIYRYIPHTYIFSYPHYKQLQTSLPCHLPCHPNYNV